MSRRIRGDADLDPHRNVSHPAAPQADNVRASGHEPTQCCDRSRLLPRSTDDQATRGSLVAVAIATAAVLLRPISRLGPGVTR